MSDQAKGLRASVFLDAEVKLDFIDLINELQRVFRNIAIEFEETALAEGGHALFQNEGMILRIGYGAADPNPDLLRRAGRPNKSKASTAMFDTLLEGLRMELVVTVSPGTGTALPERTMLAACYHVVRHIMHRFEASMVHWHPSGTLFLTEEFENPLSADNGDNGSGNGPIPRRPDPDKARRRSQRPIPGFARPASDGGIATGHARVVEARQRLADTAEAKSPVMRSAQADMARNEARLRRARHNIFGSDLIEEVDATRSRPPEEIGLLEQLSVYIMTITIMVLSFPVGFAMLVYNILRGESLKATARMMALTGIGTGVVTLNATQALAQLVA